MRRGGDTTTQTMREDNILVLSDGRDLCYAEYGDPNGKPVVLLHGNPNSRLLFRAMSGFPFRSDLRLIVPDRPGYGRSDFFPRGRGAADYPNDVIELLDSLGLEKAAVFGVSGGGPYALACAWKIPDRVTAVGVVSSLGPNVPEATVGIIHMLRLLYRLASRRPWSWIIRMQTAFTAFLGRHFLGLYIRLVSTEMTESDKELYQRLGLREGLREERKEALRQGGRASFYDITLTGNWPVPLEHIRAKVYLWQGEDDGSVGGMGRYMAGKIPGCESFFISGAGHFWVFEHMDEVLERLVPAEEQ